MIKISFRTYHLFFGLISLGTLVYDSFQNIGQIINYYSYFTTLSIVLTTVTFLYMGLTKRERAAKLNIDAARGAIVIYMLISGIVYAILLAGFPDATRVLWVDFVLHKLMPAAVTIGWILYPPHRYLNLKYILTWLIFPSIYVMYTLVRGALDGWYPYYFLNPGVNGYIGVLNFSLKLVLVSTIISLFIIVIGNTLQSHKNRA